MSIMNQSKRFRVLWVVALTVYLTVMSIALLCGVTAVFSSEWFRTIHGGLFWTGVFLALILFVAWVDLTK
ncbi:MAG TPA: hypothetical protein PK653_00080 [Syntrophales bacterium]|nr:hypothetical protein [Syntrophales bacterium]